jgi:hypothetical protein
MLLCMSVLLNFIERGSSLVNSAFICGLMNNTISNSKYSVEHLSNDTVSSSKYSVEWWGVGA